MYAARQIQRARFKRSRIHCERFNFEYCKFSRGAMLPEQWTMAGKTAEEIVVLLRREQIVSDSIWLKFHDCVGRIADVVRLCQQLAAVTMNNCRDKKIPIWPIFSEPFIEFSCAEITCAASSSRCSRVASAKAVHKNAHRAQRGCLMNANLLTDLDVAASISFYDSFCVCLSLRSCCYCCCWR